eukprot:TRINITY_DN4008_c0_g1_i1.p1 TRINITY_DN4008_c0_g1~~TRINITY_DN4008_c0_g1_i1.p1  ORF type:complete len:532 (+),score=116.05 TRINITY_DN4008_c0_g1_i1:126-1721(+)
MNKPTVKKERKKVLPPRNFETRKQPVKRVAIKKKVKNDTQTGDTPPISPISPMPSLSPSSDSTPQTPPSSPVTFNFTLTPTSPISTSLVNHHQHSKDQNSGEMRQTHNYHQLYRQKKNFNLKSSRESVSPPNRFILEVEKISETKKATNLDECDNDEQEKQIFISSAPAPSHKTLSETLDEEQDSSDVCKLEKPRSNSTSAPRVPRIRRRMDANEEDRLMRAAHERRVTGTRAMTFVGEVPTEIGLDPSDEIQEAPNSTQGFIAESTASSHQHQHHTDDRIKSTSRKFCVGFADTVGRRNKMEDAMVFYGSCVEKPSIDLFAIFDGHRDREMSLYLRDHLPKKIIKRMNDQPLSELDDISLVIGDCLRSSFLEINQEMKQKHILGGSTALVTLFTHRSVFIGNVGDCRALFCSNNVSTRLTRDHRANDFSEMRRIKDSGGEITTKMTPEGKIISRVGGVLAISRTFGDWEVGLYVAPNPDVYQIQAPGNENEFIIVASDGLFDVINDYQAGQVVSDYLKEKRGDLKGAACR